MEIEKQCSIGRGKGYRSEGNSRCEKKKASWQTNQAFSRSQLAKAASRLMSMGYNPSRNEAMSRGNPAPALFKRR